MNKWNDWLYKYKRVHSLYKSNWNGEFEGDEYRFSLATANGKMFSMAMVPNSVIKHYAAAGGLTIKEHMELVCLHRAYNYIKAEEAKAFVKCLPKKEYNLVTRWLNQSDYD